MSFSIAYIKEVPNMNILPVALIKHFKPNKNRYKPYTQCKFCVTDTELISQLISFEVNPKEKSCIKTVLVGKNILDITVFADKKYKISLGEKDITEKTIVNFYGGEDLQGIFWGANIHIPFKDTELSLKPNDILKGNFYKLLYGTDKEHFGSFYEISDFTDLDKNHMEMGEFKITEL